MVYRERRILHSRLSDVLRPTSTRLEKLRYLERVAQLGFVPHENYFNAGVLVMDCDVIRREYPHYAELSCPDKLRPFRALPDQDRLNAFFAGRWCPLPLRWNVRPGIKRDVEYRPYRFRHVSSTLWQQLRDATADPKLWHFMGFPKPWVKPWVGYVKLIRPAYRDYIQTCREVWHQTGVRFGL